MPAARTTLRTPAANPNSRNTIIPHGEVPSHRSNNQPKAAPTKTPATNSADNRSPRASADRSPLAPPSGSFSEGRSDRCWPSRSPSRCNLADSSASSAGGSLRSSSWRAWAMNRPCETFWAICSGIRCIKTQTMHSRCMLAQCTRPKQRFQQDRGRSAAPEAARTILSGSGQVKKPHSLVKLLTHMQISGVARLPDPGQEGLNECFSRHRNISAVLCRPARC
jgi:hypothetical protein